MKVFDFVAFNSSGRKKTGFVKARSLSEARKKVQRGGFYLVSIEAQNDSVSYPQESLSLLLKELKRFLFSKKKVSL